MIGQPAIIDALAECKTARDVRGGVTKNSIFDFYFSNADHGIARRASSVIFIAASRASSCDMYVMTRRRARLFARR